MASILLIEDNDLLNQSYVMLLGFHGHTVTSAFNGKEGLEKALELKPDLILLDYFMPVMDGREFLQAYSATDQPKSKIILLTNTDEKDKIDEAFDLGISHYLLKANLSPDQLIEQVARFTS